MLATTPEMQLLVEFTFILIPSIETLFLMGGTLFPTVFFFFLSVTCSAHCFVVSHFKFMLRVPQQCMEHNFNPVS